MEDQTQSRITRSAGGVVINDLGQILIVSQKGTSWSLPKGHVEEGEEILDAAKREVLEESGVSELELMKEFPMYERMKIAEGGVGEDTSELKLIHMFLFRTNQIELHPFDKENPEAIWLPPEKIPELLTHPKDRAFYDRVLPDIMMYIQSRN